MIGSAKHSIPHETLIELHVKDLVQANSSTKSTDHIAIGLMAALKLESSDHVSIYVTGIQQQSKVCSVFWLLLNV